MIVLAYIREGNLQPYDGKISGPGAIPLHLSLSLHTYHDMHYVEIHGIPFSLSTVAKERTPHILLKHHLSNDEIKSLSVASVTLCYIHARGFSVLWKEKYEIDFEASLANPVNFDLKQTLKVLGVPFQGDDLYYETSALQMSHENEVRSLKGRNKEARANARLEELLRAPHTAQLNIGAQERWLDMKQFLPSRQMPEGRPSFTCPVLESIREEALRVLHNTLRVKILAYSEPVRVTYSMGSYHTTSQEMMLEDGRILFMEGPFSIEGRHFAGLIALSSAPDSDLQKPVMCLEDVATFLHQAYPVDASSGSRF